MCLSVRETIPHSKIAKHHILVWKILEKKSGRWVAPYQRTPYAFGVEYTSKLQYTSIPEDWNTGSCGTVSDGRHAFTDETSAKHRMLSWGDDHAVFPAVVPAGSKFYFDPVRREIAANTLIVFNTLADVTTYFDVYKII